FTKQYLRGLLASWLVIGAGSFLLACTQLSGSAFAHGVALLGAVCLYYALSFLCPRLGRKVLPREAMVALFFTLGTFLFVWCESPEAGIPLVGAGTWFGALCFLNCYSVS